MFKDREERRCLPGLEGLCSWQTRTQAVGKVVLERWSGGLQKGRADVLGLCPKVPSMMSWGPNAAEDSNRLKAPKPKRGLKVRTTWDSTRRASPLPLGTEGVKAWGQGLARSVVVQELWLSE